MLAPNARFVQRRENCYGRLRITGAQSSRKSGFRRKEAQKRRVYAREPAACFATTTTKTTMESKSFFKSNFQFSTKDQLISKGIFGVFNFSKNEQKT